MVLAPDAAEPSMPAGIRATFVHDAIEGEGPLRGLAAGLEATNAEWALLAGGDMPYLQLGVLRQMLRAARETRAVAAMLSDAGEERPLPCVLRRAAAAEVTRDLLAAGRRSLKDLMAAVSTVVIDEPTWTALDPKRRTLVDVDEPADLDR